MRYAQVTFFRVRLTGESLHGGLMSPGWLLQEEQIDALRRLDTCTVSNAIETFDVRLRNTGFADARIRCMFEDLPNAS